MTPSPRPCQGIEVPWLQQGYWWHYCWPRVNSLVMLLTVLEEGYPRWKGNLSGKSACSSELPLCRCEPVSMGAWGKLGVLCKSPGRRGYGAGSGQEEVSWQHWQHWLHDTKEAHSLQEPQLMGEVVWVIGQQYLQAKAKCQWSYIRCSYMEVTYKVQDAKYNDLENHFITSKTVLKGQPAALCQKQQALLCRRSRATSWTNLFGPFSSTLMSRKMVKRWF